MDLFKHLTKNRLEQKSKAQHGAGAALGVQGVTPTPQEELRVWPAGSQRCRHRSDRDFLAGLAAATAQGAAAAPKPEHC